MGTIIDEENRRGLVEGMLFSAALEGREGGTFLCVYFPSRGQSDLFGFYREELPAIAKERKKKGRTRPVEHKMERKKGMGGQPQY